MITRVENYIGVMSGSSLDGLDIALVQFVLDARNHIQSWEIIKTRTEHFDAQLKDQLGHYFTLDLHQYFQLETTLSSFIADSISRLLEGRQDISCMGIHGHTLVHYPDQNITKQMAQGGIIASMTGIDTVVDFRIQDVCKGGSGAPIVPAVERSLFRQFKAFLNLGGIVNISDHRSTDIIAFDIAPCNQLLNYLANKVMLDYDDKGMLASEGSINLELMNRLIKFDYYQQSPPKALDNNWIRKEVIPLLDHYDVKDALHTCVHFIAEQIAANVNDLTEILVTGGGAYNDFLIKVIRSKVPNTTFTIPSDDIIEYKEAVLMAYLAYCRKYEFVNVHHKVTGAAVDSIAGAYYKSMT